MTDTTLTLSRFIKASPVNVWRCWTEPALLKQWFAPKPVETILAEIDPRPGGGFKTIMRVPDHGDMGGDAGCILVADPGVRLVWTNILGPEFIVNTLGDGPMDFGFATDISFTAKDGGCQYDVRVHHGTIAAAEAHAKMGFHEGWGMATTQLAEISATL